MWKLDKKVIFLLLGILLIGGFLRIYSLNTTPPGLYPDEAMNANDALTNPGKVFYPENNGREGLYMNLVALDFKIFGASPFSLRITSAFIGILTILGLYFLTKELFTNLKFSVQNSKKLALISSFFLSISFWHINFSRIGFRGILLPFVLVFSFYYFFLGLRKHNRASIIASAIFFGLGFYTYSSFRLAFLILPFIVIPYWFVYKKEKLQKQFLAFAGYFSLTTFLVALPLGLYFLRHPADFFGRLGPISVFSQPNPIKAFFISLGGHLAMFNISGDFNWRHNLSGSPELLWPIGLLFLIGIIVAFQKLFLDFKNRKNKKINYQSLSVYLFLLAWFFVMILPGALTYEGIPHSLRTIGLIPVVYIFASMGCLWIFKKLKKGNYRFLNLKDKNLKLYLGFILIFLVFTLFIAQYQKYFEAWGKNPEVQGAFTQRFLNIGKTLNSIPSSVQKYIIVNEPGTPVPYPDGPPVSAQTIMFAERAKYGELRTIYLTPEQLSKMEINNNNQVAVIPMRFDNEIAKQIKRSMPGGFFNTINNIKIYEIEQY